MLFPPRCLGVSRWPVWRPVERLSAAGEGLFTDGGGRLQPLFSRNRSFCSSHDGSCLKTVRCPGNSFAGTLCHLAKNKGPEADFGPPQRFRPLDDSESARSRARNRMNQVKKISDTEKADSHQCDAHPEADRFESRRVVTTGIISPSRVCGLVKEFPARNGYAVLAPHAKRRRPLCAVRRGRGRWNASFSESRAAPAAR